MVALGEKVSIVCVLWPGHARVERCVVVEEVRGGAMIDLNDVPRPIARWAVLPALEGIGWCREWTGPAADALRAAIAMDET